MAIDQKSFTKLVNQELKDKMKRIKLSIAKVEEREKAVEDREKRVAHREDMASSRERRIFGKVMNG